MKTNLRFIVFCLCFLISVLSLKSYGQTMDTITNWDGITLNWTVLAGESEIIANPHKEGINVSAHCLDVVTTVDLYDLLLFDMAQSVNFNDYPIYHVKFYPPSGGGDVAFKFENSTNTISHEIVMATTPGEWNDVSFNFSGLSFETLTRMVIFFDFNSTITGEHWLIDDITREALPPLQLESTLPIVVINTNGVPVPDDPKISATMGIIDNGPGATNNLNDLFNDFDGNIGIEIRGQSTQMFPKKSYGFETRDPMGENLNVSILGMPAENDWILYAPYTDKSMLRNLVSYDIWHKMGRYCTRTKYCELVLNGDYKGVYILMEKIKKDKNRVDIATLNPEEITGDDVTGGYMLTIDWVKDYYIDNIDGWKSDPNPSYPNAMDIIFQYYYPEAATMAPEQRAYIKNYVTTAENTLTGAGFAHPDLGYPKYMDVSSFVDFMLLSEISKEVDKYRYSTYLYKQKDSDGGKLFAGPVWDFNLGYGNVDYWDFGLGASGWLYRNVENHSASIIFWWKRMMEDPCFKNLAKTRWVKLRQNQLKDESFAALIDSATQIIDEAKDRNYQRWPILGQYVWPNYNWQNNTYIDEKTYFENFLFDRLHWMDANMPGTVLNPRVGISAESNKINVKLYDEYFNKPTLSINNFMINDAPSGMYIQSIEYLNATECTINISAEVATFQEVSVTVRAEVLNASENLTSNKLVSSGSGDNGIQSRITVYTSNNEIHICCNQIEILPSTLEIRNVIGQRTGLYNIEKVPENIISVRLTPGVYFLILYIKGRYQVHQIAII